MSDNRKVPVIREPNFEAKVMSAITAKGGIRNKKIINYLEKYLYPDIRVALQEVFLADINLCIVDNDNS